MLIGDVQVWANRFITVDDRFHERVLAAWPSCVAVLGQQPIEDEITINLVARLSTDPVVRRICHFVAYQHEPFGLAPDGKKYSKGKIDIAVIFDWERERYLAYECKRLNVTTAQGKSTLATAYVTEGMMRFITEQYAEGLPIGAMLGYVMDGDTSSAWDKLNAKITSHQPLALVGTPTTICIMGAHPRFETRHKRAGGSEVALRHTLLAY